MPQYAPKLGDLFAGLSRGARDVGDFYERKAERDELTRRYEEKKAEERKRRIFDLQRSMVRAGPEEAPAHMSELRRLEDPMAMQGGTTEPMQPPGTYAPGEPLPVIPQRVEQEGPVRPGEAPPYALGFGADPLATVAEQAPPTQPLYAQLFDRMRREGLAAQEAATVAQRKLEAGVLGSPGYEDLGLQAAREGSKAPSLEDVRNRGVEIGKQRIKEKKAGRSGTKGTSLSSFVSLYNAGFKSSNKAVLEKSLKGIESHLGPGVMGTAEDVLDAKGRRERQAIAQKHYSATSPFMRMNIQNKQVELNGITKSAAGLTEVGRNRSRQLIGEIQAANKSLADLMESAGVAPWQIRLRRRSKPLSADAFDALVDKEVQRSGKSHQEVADMLSEEFNYTLKDAK